MAWVVNARRAVGILCIWIYSVVSALRGHWALVNQEGVIARRFSLLVPLKGHFLLHVTGWCSTKRCPCDSVSLEFTDT